MSEPIYMPSHFAAKYPQRSAVAMAASGERWTYRDLNEAANRTAHLLRAAKLKRGDHVALMLENSLAFYGIVWAARRSGLYFTPINTRLTADEVEYVLDDCGAKAVFISSLFASVATQLRETPTSSDRILFSVGGDISGYRSLEQEASIQPDTPIENESNGAALLYSSGTTGRPKGIKRPLNTEPLGKLDIFTRKISELYHFGEDTIYLCPTPIYHGAGLAYTTMLHCLGGSSIVMEKFDPEGFLSAIETHRVTHTQVVPTIFVRLLKLPKHVRDRYDLSSLRVVIHAAAPCPLEIKDAMLDWLGPIVYEYFAATEANGYTFISPQEWIAHRGSVGRAVVGNIHIVDDNGAECPTGVPGTVYFSGLPPFEYYKDSTRTAEARHPLGWTTTGDVGYLDEEQYLYLTDRKAFTIISGGVNIYPQEVENLLIVHPDVMDAAVFGVPDPEFQEQVKAVVQLSDPSTANDEMEEKLIAYCRERLAHYKCPKSIDFLPDLPRLENGKLYKRLLRDKYWGGHDTRIF